jgi:tetratricopeptide (TPR) repeat protein
MKGDSYFYLGDFDKAIKYYNKGIELKPENPEAWVMKGDAYYFLGDCDEAIKTYDKALELEPDNKIVEVTLFLKGISYACLEDHDEALKYVDQALELNPEYVDAWEMKGELLTEMGRTKEAKVCFDKVEELSS